MSDEVADCVIGACPAKRGDVGDPRDDDLAAFKVVIAVRLLY